MRNEGCGWSLGVAWWEGELDAIVGQNRMDLVRNRLDQCDEEGRGGDPVGLFLQPDKDKFARPINGDEEMELALGGLHLGDVDVEEADRIAFELPPRGDVARDVWQARDVVALQAAVQRRAAEMRNGRLQ